MTSRFDQNFGPFIAVLIGGAVVHSLENVIISNKCMCHKRRGLEIFKQSPEYELSNSRYSDIFKYNNNRISGINSDFFIKHDNIQKKNLLEKIAADIESCERAGFISKYTKNSALLKIKNFIS